MANDGQYLHGYPRKPPIRELNWHSNPTDEVVRCHPSHNSYPAQSNDRYGKTNNFDLVDTVKSPDGASSFKSIHSEFINTDTSNVRFVEEISHVKKHSLSPELCLDDSPKSKKNSALWNECLPLSFELNSNVERPTRTNASNQNWSAPQLTADQIHKERLDLPVRLFEGIKRSSSPMIKPLICEHRNVPRVNKSTSSYCETSPFSPVNEKKFCERIDDLTNSLKKATSQFESRIMARQKQSNDDHTQQHSWGPLPFSAGEGHLSSLGDARPDPFFATLNDDCVVSAKSVQLSSPFGRNMPYSFSRDSETNDDSLLVESQLEKPSLLHSNVRKPLEPIESGNGDEHRYQPHSSADQRINRIDIYSSNNTHKKTDKTRERKDPVTPKRSGSDPPGHKPARRSNGFAQRSVREAILINNNHSPRNIAKKIQEPLDPITRNQYGADPPESDSQARGVDPEYRNDKCVHRGSAFTQNSSRQACTSRNGIASPEKRDANQSSPRSIFTSQQSMCTDMHLSENICSSSSSYPKRVTSLSSKGLVQLNIPSWVDDEIDTPIKPVNSFGETSMDRLLRKIDEIENDFSTIVASLPGSDGLSLKVSKSDDNSTLASKSTFEIHQEAEQTKHQLASDSFESHGSQGEIMTGILQQMRLVQDQIEQLECAELDDGSEGDYESQGEMAELIQRLANAAESLRSLQVE
jgi:hypothetical protein